MIRRPEKRQFSDEGYGAGCQVRRLVPPAAANRLLQADQGRAESCRRLCRADQGDGREGTLLQSSNDMMNSGAWPQSLDGDKGAAHLAGRFLAGAQAPSLQSVESVPLQSDYGVRQRA